MNTEAEWKKALRKSPGDNTLLLAYADWLEENGDQLRACKARQDAGAGTLVYRLTHPSWGGELFGEFAKLLHLKQHINLKLLMRPTRLYARTPAEPGVNPDELTVVVEWVARPVEIARRPFTRDLQL